MMYPSVFLRIALLAFGLAGLAPPAYAAPGDLDTSFGGGFGRVRAQVGGDLGWVRFSTSEVSGQPSIALQPDGKIVLAGSCKIGATYDFCVVRHNSNGTADATFGDNGLVRTDVRSGDDFVAGLAIQPDGKIVLAGTCQNNLSPTTGRDFCVVRYTAAGALDTGFSGDGKLTVSFSSFDDVATSMALQPDGKIVLAGYCTNNAGAFNSSGTFGTEVCLARITSIGDLDTSFNRDGKLITAIGGAIPTRIRNKANAIAIAADGKIVITGSNYVGTDASFADTNLLLARFLPSGTLDATFASDGVVSVDTLSWIVGNAVAIQPDGQIIVAGYRVGGCPGNDGAVALCFTESGALDSKFGSFGFATLDLDSSALGSFTYSVALQVDGKTVLAGHCAEAGGRQSFCFARLNSDGGLDKTFASNGIGSIQFEALNYDYGFSVAVQPDGKIVLGGLCVESSGSSLCIARLEGGPFGARNCSLDIDGDGRVLATTDSLIHARIALGITGGAVIGGINFPVGATRDQWGSNTSRDIRKFLLTHCGMVLR